MTESMSMETMSRRIADVESFVSGMLDDINPLTYYPFLKDAWSVLQGYDVERSDMSLISDLADSMKSLVKAYSSEDGDVSGAWWDLAGTAANIGGIPVQNIRREVKGAENFYNTLSLDLNGRKTTWGSMKDTLQKNVRNTLPVIGWLPGESKTDKLYDAIVSGDTAYVNRLKSGYDKESSYNIAVRKALRENDPRIHEAAVARNNGNIAEYTRIAREIIGEGHFSQDDVVAAINAEINAIDKGEATPAARKASGLYKAEDFATAISQNDSAMANAVKSDIIQTAQKNGKTGEEALKSFNSSAKSELKEMFLSGQVSEDQAVSALVSFCGDEHEDAEERVAEWAFESEHGFVYGDCKEMFLEGEISASELKSVIMDVEGKTSDEAGTKIVSYCREAYEDDYFSRSEAASIMVTYGGMTRAEAEDKLRYIDVKKQFPDTYVDDAWVTEYYKEVQSSGITIEVFVDYRNKVKGITGKDKKEMRMEVIDSLPISSAQKDALYLAEGWAKSTLKKAPWH